MKSQFDANSYVDGGTTVYTMSNFYALGSSYAVPLTMMGSGLEPFSYEDNVVRIGGTAGNHVSNACWVMSKRCFKYNPTAYYRIRVRAKFSAAVPSFSAGFIGLTSVPVEDLLPLNASDNANSILNVSRFVMGANGVSGTNFDFSGMPHHNCIRASGFTANTYTILEGIIKGKASTISYADTTIGKTASNPLPMRNEILYFAPYFLANEGSVSKDAMLTYIDYMTVEELHDEYVMV